MGHNPQKIKERILKQQEQNITENKINPTNTFVGVDALVGMPQEPIMANNVYRGDCLELMKMMDDKSVNLIVTDPPYGIKINRSSNQFGTSTNNSRKATGLDRDDSIPTKE